MKTAFAAILFVSGFLLFPSSLFAQDHAAVGPPQVSFAATADGTQHPTPQPDPDKAVVFVIEDLGQCSDCYGGHSIISDVSGALVKVGVDGSWIGATKGDSYIFLATTPGEHHLCVNWQSRLGERARSFAMADLNAEAGNVYYFRVKLFPGQGDFSFDLDPINSDHGKFLVASSPFSTSHAKK